MSIAVKIGKMSELPDFEQYFKAKKRKFQDIYYAKP